MNTDSIADMLNRIRTAQAVRKPVVDIPFSRMKYEIAQCLEREGFVEKVSKKKKQNLRYLRVFLRYDKEEPVIAELKRVSSPGQRIYTKRKELREVKGGRGISILSTPKGVLTHKEAKKNNLGGEVLCEIW